MTRTGNGARATRGHGGRFTGSNPANTRPFGATRAPALATRGARPRATRNLATTGRPRKPRRPRASAMRPWTITPTKLAYQFRMTAYYLATHKRGAALWTLGTATAGTGAYLTLRLTGVALTGAGFLGMALLSRTTTRTTRRRRR